MSTLQNLKPIVTQNLFQIERILGKQSRKPNNPSLIKKIQEIALKNKKL